MLNGKCVDFHVFVLSGSIGADVECAFPVTPSFIERCWDEPLGLLRERARPSRRSMCYRYNAAYGSFSDEYCSRLKFFCKGLLAEFSSAAVGPSCMHVHADPTVLRLVTKCRIILQHIEQAYWLDAGCVQTPQDPRNSRGCGLLERI